MDVPASARIYHDLVSLDVPIVASASSSSVNADTVPGQRRNLAFVQKARKKENPPSDLCPDINTW